MKSLNRILFFILAAICSLVVLTGCRTPTAETGATGTVGTAGTTGAPGATGNAGTDSTTGITTSGAPAQAEYWPGESWRTSTPEEQGMNSAKLLTMLEYIKNEKMSVHSIVIIRNGYEVLDANFFPYKSDARHAIFSCTKSVTSALFGIAEGEGLIGGTEQKVLDYFSDRTLKNLDGRKKSLTLGHLLTMTAGFEWSENGLYDASDSWVNMMGSTDPVGYILDKPMSEAPGTSFYYNTGESHLLSAVLQKATGKKAFDYAREKLFEPLGIRDVYWQELGGSSIGGGGINMSPRDMAKFGYLFLKNGRWNGEQIVPESWVKEAVKKHVDTPSGLAGRHGYGYQWWMNGFGGYSARGYGGQYIFVVPQYDIVAVFTGALTGSNFFLPEDMMEGFVIPACTRPEEADAGAPSRLRDELREIGGASKP